jgi:hypothetical protein
MAARSGVVFLASMVDILANPVEICFGGDLTNGLREGPGDL